jgi:hypothetical protein
MIVVLLVKLHSQVTIPEAISRALHRAIETTGRCIVNVQVGNGFGCKEIPDGLFQCPSLDNPRACHHSGFVVSPNR